MLLGKGGLPKKAAIILPGVRTYAAFISLI